MRARDRSGRPRRRIRRFVVALTLLAALVGTVAVAAPWALGKAGMDQTALPWGPECSVRVDSGPVGLSVEDARRATTAVALEARDADTPDTSDIDAAVMDRLRDGPPAGPGPVLTCRAEAAGDLAAEDMAGSGLTPRAERVRAEIRKVFGERKLGGFAPGGVRDGHKPGSAHYDGRAIDVFYRPVSEENRREGWLLANWLVAHSGPLHVANVIFDDQIWNSRGSRAGWWDYHSSDPDNEILRHLDHVHVDVHEGDDGAGDTG